MRNAGDCKLVEGNMFIWGIPERSGCCCARIFHSTIFVVSAFLSVECNE